MRRFLPSFLIASTLVFAPLAAVGLQDAGHAAWAGAGPESAATGAPSANPPSSRSSVDPAQRDHVLPKNWRGSKDVAVATAGDASGFHVLLARASEGYEWRPLATLSEPGLDTDQWIGNACMTGSGKHVMVVYAPRHFTNRSDLFARGAFAATVDLDSGTVTKLADQGTLAYFNPGCGADDTVALTQGATEEHPSTRLVTVTAGSGKSSGAMVVPGQLSSAVPYQKGVVAAGGPELVAVSKGGRVRALAKTGSTPFDVHVDAQGGIAFAEQVDGRVNARYYHQGTIRTVAEGPLGKLSVQAGSGGHVFLVGDAANVRDMPPNMSVVPAASQGRVSSDGELVVESAARQGLRAGDAGDPHDTGIAAASAGSPGAEPVDVAAQVPSTRAKVAFEVPLSSIQAPKSPSGGLVNPRLARTKGTRTQASAVRPEASAGTSAAAADNPVDEGYTCAVPRNDPRLQVYQPHWRQVEWAVDQLVQKRLSLTRPQNWKGSGLPAWSPQSMFPAEDLRGGGRVPTNILLGILAQESNLWQAQRRVFEGETGNPLVGNYYGVNIYDSDPSNDWAIDFSKADCGYGISQQTDGMRKAGSERPGETAWPADKQKAVALDYVTNIAAGLRTLTQKWNQVYDDTGGAMKANDGNAAKLENWYFAIWAYNSGWHPKSAANGNDENGEPNNGAWGLGWTNNPSNSYWRPGRHPFLDGNTYQDAATPQYWPYQEKVLGWAAWPITKTYYDTSGNLQEQAGYNAAWWNGSNYRSMIVPTVDPVQFVVDVNAFCVAGTAGNQCQPVSGVPRSQPGTCTRADFKCWWHLPKAWKTDCPANCGNEGTIRYSEATWASTEREEPRDYWTPCNTPGLPSGALIVDDVPSTVPAIRGGCDNSGWTNSGTFALEFGHDAAGKSPAKADFQQLGNGFGGHQWFGYTRQSSQEAFKITGTWTLDRAINGPARVFVHLPDHYGYTKQARYDIATAKGTRTRVISQDVTGSRWQSVGAFLFNGVPKVTLSSVVPDGTGDETVVWDAIAIQPVNGTYVEDTVEAIALFDESQNIDGDPTNSYITNTPLESRQQLYDWALKVSGDITALPTCTGGPAATCVMPRTKDVMQQWRSTVLAAGIDPVNHPPGQGLNNWIHFANPYTYRPTSSSKPSWWDSDDESYKIKSKATVSFVKDNSTNKIINGSEYVAYEHRTGDTVLPKFVLDSFAAIAADYGIARPDLTYSAVNLNRNDGHVTAVNANSNGILPGRAFPDKGVYKLVGSDGKPVSGDGDCVYTRYTSGGVIGFSPMLGASKPSVEVANWVALASQRAGATGNKDMPTPVAQLAIEINNMFFAAGNLGSIFYNAPPIWHSLQFDLCADGSIHRRDGSRPILLSSFMPDQYLYRNGKAIGLDGSYSNSAAPVLKGQWDQFSHLPGPPWNLAIPYGGCSEMYQGQGNPWGIVPPGAGLSNPATGNLCTLPPGAE